MAWAALGRDGLGVRHLEAAGLPVRMVQRRAASTLADGWMFRGIGPQGHLEGAIASPASRQASHSQSFRPNTPPPSIFFPAPCEREVPLARTLTLTTFVWDHVHHAQRCWGSQPPPHHASVKAEGFASLRRRPYRRRRAQPAALHAGHREALQLLHICCTVAPGSSAPCTSERQQQGARRQACCIPHPQPYSPPSLTFVVRLP